MIKVKILSVGKTKEVWLEQAINEYTQRLQNQITFEFCWCKDDDALLAQVERSSGKTFGLDPLGKMHSSEQFADFFDAQTVAGGAKVNFVIGGAGGLPIALKQTLPLVSLSPMTFTHQITRLILVEQIYRANEILKGTKYHKA